MRSAWKIPYIASTFFKKRFKKEFTDVNIKLRNSLIPATFVHMRVQVHSGIYWKSVDISNDMLGHRFGEFSTTKNCSGQRDKNEERNRKTRKSKRKGSKHN